MTWSADDVCAYFVDNPQSSIADIAMETGLTIDEICDILVSVDCV